MYIWNMGMLPSDHFDEMWEANKHYYITHKAGPNYDVDTEAEWKEKLHITINNPYTICMYGYEVPDDYDFDEDGWPDGSKIIMIKVWQKFTDTTARVRPIDRTLDKLAPTWRTDGGTWAIEDTYFKEDSNGNKDWMATTWPQRAQFEIRNLPKHGVLRHMLLVKGQVQKAYCIREPQRSIYHSTGARFLRGSYVDDNETLLYILLGNLGGYSDLEDYEVFYRPDEDIT